MNALDLFLLLCCSAACVRLIFYRRKGSTFKRGVSLIAWLAIVLTGSISLLLITGRISSGQIHPLLYFMLIMLAILILLARGNVAQIIRMTRGQV